MANDLRRSFPELFLEADVPCTIARTVIRGNNRTWYTSFFVVADVYVVELILVHDIYSSTRGYLDIERVPL